MQNIKRYSLSLLALLLVFGCFLRFSSAKPVYAADIAANMHEYQLNTGIQDVSVHWSYNYPTSGIITHDDAGLTQVIVPVQVNVAVWNFNQSNVWLQNFFQMDFQYVPTNANGPQNWRLLKVDSNDLHLVNAYAVSSAPLSSTLRLQLGLGADSVYNGAPNGLTFPALQITNFGFTAYFIADIVNSSSLPSNSIGGTLSVNFINGIWDTTEYQLSGNAQIVQGITEQTQQQQEQYEDFTSPETQESGELIEDTQTEVESKIGLFTFIEDMLIDIFDIFEVDEQSTTLTLPAFSMQIDGVTHQVWQDTTFDLSDIDTHIPALMVAVRFATVSLVYIALINYLIKLYHRIFMEEKT